jgi:hypothetical protein
MALELEGPSIALGTHDENGNNADLIDAASKSMHAISVVLSTWSAEIVLMA